MPSIRFVRRDRRFFAQALSNGTSHGGLSLFESGLGTTTEGNKDQRSSAIVAFIFDRFEDSDQAVLDLLNFLYVDGAPSAWAATNEYFVALKREVLDPRGIVLTDEGYTFTDAPTQAEAPSEVTAREVSVPSMSASASSRSKVFVVSGRDQRPVAVIRTFLHFAGLQVMDWSEAVTATGIPQPTTYEIVRAGMASASAVLVIFSPDEEARLHPDFASSPDDPDLLIQRQPRQNVLLEAGMAFASEPGKTIFIKSGRTRDISDIQGFNWIKLDGTWDSRSDLISRLENAQVPIHLAHSNLMDSLAGTFKVE